MITEYNKDVNIQYKSERVAITDLETGETQEKVLLTKKEYGNNAFVKLFDRGRNNVREALGFSRWDVLDYLLFKMKASDNLCSYTCDEISEVTGVPIRTVNRIMVRFQKYNIVVKRSRGKWRINPWDFGRYYNEQGGKIMKDYCEDLDKKREKADKKLDG